MLFSLTYQVYVQITFFDIRKLSIWPIRATASRASTQNSSEIGKDEPWLYFTFLAGAALDTVLLLILF